MISSIEISVPTLSSSISVDGIFVFISMSRPKPLFSKLKISKPKLSFIFHSLKSKFTLVILNIKFVACSHYLLNVVFTENVSVLQKYICKKQLLNSF